MFKQSAAVFQCSLPHSHQVRREKEKWLRGNISVLKIKHITAWGLSASAECGRYGKVASGFFLQMSFSWFTIKLHNWSFEGRKEVNQDISFLPLAFSVYHQLYEWRGWTLKVITSSLMELHNYIAMHWICNKKSTHVSELSEFSHKTEIKILQLPLLNTHLLCTHFNTARVFVKM